MRQIHPPPDAPRAVLDEVDGGPIVGSDLLGSPDSSRSTVEEALLPAASEED